MLFIKDIFDINFFIKRIYAEKMFATFVLHFIINLFIFVNNYVNIVIWKLV